MRQRAHHGSRRELVSQASLLTSAVCLLAASAAADIVRTNAFGLGADAQINEQNGGTETRGDHWELAARYSPGVHNQHMLIRLDLSGITASDLAASPLTSLQMFVNRNGWNQSPTTFQYFGLRPEAANQFWNESTVTFRNAPGTVYDGDLLTRGFTSDLSLIGEQTLSGPRPAGSAIEFADTGLRAYLQSVISHYQTSAGTPVATFLVALKEGSPANQNFVVKSNDADSAAGTGLLSGSQYNPQLVLAPLPSGTLTSQWRAGSGVWSGANNWTRAHVPNNTATTGFDVTFALPETGNELGLDMDVTVDRYRQVNGTLVADATPRRLVVRHNLELSDVVLRSRVGGRLTVESHGRGTLETDLYFQNVSLHNYGQMTIDSILRSTLGSSIHNHAGATFDLAGTAGIETSFINDGVVRKTSNDGPNIFEGGLRNNGAVFVDRGSLWIQDDSGGNGTFEVAEGAELRFLSGSAHHVDPAAIIRGEGKVAFSHNSVMEYSGTLANKGGIEISYGGAVRFEPGAIVRPDVGTWRIGPGSASFNTGSPATLTTVELNAGTLAGSDVIEILSRLSGTGSSNASLLISGILAPGIGVGSIYSEVSCELAPGSRLEMELSAAGFDQIFAKGAFQLGGSLALSLVEGFTPSTDVSFVLLDNDAPVTGMFNNVAPGGRLHLADGSSFQVNYGPTSAFGSDKVVLSNFILPEPATLTAIAACGLGIGRRSRAGVRLRR